MNCPKRKGLGLGKKSELASLARSKKKTTQQRKLLWTEYCKAPV